MLASDLLTSYHKQFAYYRYLGEKTMAQLSAEELFKDDAAGSNSVAVIVKHLAGNMKSRWTDFLTTDGEKPWRNREQEFVADFPDRGALETAWAKGWSALEKALMELSPDQLAAVIYIRNEGHSVAEALNRQLAHYAYHVGQIVLLGKQLKGEAWQSLSIPRGKSAAYNQAKFSEEKGRRNFIDGLME
ncbi:MAG: DinB family protein [Bacteroidota bacterium]